MPQTIDLYTPQRQAMAEALQLLQRRQAMNEQRRQWEEQQKMLQQQAAIEEAQRQRGNAWEDETRNFARRQMAELDPAAAAVAGTTIYTDKVPNKEFTERLFQQGTMTPGELRNADLYATGNAVSPVKQAEFSNAQTVAGINQGPQWARVPSQNAADAARANSSNASAKLFTARANSPQAGQKPVQTRLDPQTEARANRLDADIKNLDARINQTSAMATGSKESSVRRRATEVLSQLQAQRDKKQQEYDALVKAFPSEAYTTPGAGASEEDNAITAAIMRELGINQE